MQHLTNSISGWREAQLQLHHRIQLLSFGLRKVWAIKAIKIHQRGRWCHKPKSDIVKSLQVSSRSCLNWPSGTTGAKLQSLMARGSVGSRSYSPLGHQSPVSPHSWAGGEIRERTISKWCFSFTTGMSWVGSLNPAPQKPGGCLQQSIITASNLLRSILTCAIPGVWSNGLLSSEAAIKHHTVPAWWTEKKIISLMSFLIIQTVKNTLIFVNIHIHTHWNKLPKLLCT